MALASTTFDYDHGRQVSAYVPAAPPELVVFCGDGQLIASWGEGLAAAGAPPTLIVGAHRSSDPDEMVRLHEYSPGFEPERFAAHEGWFLEAIMPWARAEFGALPALRTVFAGVSAGAELALAMGLRHPELFGTIFAASPGAGYRPPAELPAPLPRTWLTAGTEEPFFLGNATRWHAALSAASADVVLRELPGEHGGPFWQAEFVRMLGWALAD
ncbi:esterase [Devosia insulae DS-56]|uniref:Esterase n=1 Tax=Devosia insulae DS-56 TaxID=1116389 RepID=A0A1E5XUJ6_9HYPH|nr:alpha/beta hydrolase-fold protein [Devosia insulae]OEO32251.1 esterase [Devosia insulae DS-56]